MSDSISRADTIKMIASINEPKGQHHLALKGLVPIDHVIKAIEDMPSTDRPIGEWIKYTNFNGELKTYECSNCKYPQGHKTPYCCECGAKMKGEEDED